MDRIPHRASVALAEPSRGKARASTRSFVARLFVPLWVSIALVLAMLVATGEATAATRSHTEGAAADRATSHRVADTIVDELRGPAQPSRLCRDDRAPSPVLELLSEPEDEHAFQAPTAASAFVPIPSSSILDRPSYAAPDTDRSSAWIGLGRGPPQQRR